MSQGPERIGGASGGSNSRQVELEDEQVRLRRQIEEAAAQHVQRSTEAPQREAQRVSDDDTVRLERVRERERVAPAHQTDAANAQDARLLAQDNERLAALGEIANDDARRGEARLVEIQSLNRQVHAAQESGAARDALRDERARELRVELEAELTRRVSGQETKIPALVPPTARVTLAELGGGLREPDDRDV